MERKKQRLEQPESERATLFDLQEKLKAICEKRDKKRKHAETVHEKVRKAQEEAERVDLELAECEDQYKQMEQWHRAAAEQFTREQQAFQPLAVWESLRTLHAEIGADAAANSAVELLLSVCQPIEQRRREQHEAQPKPSSIMMTPKWQRNRFPHLMTLSKWSESFARFRRGMT